MLFRSEHSKLWLREIAGGWQFSDMTTLQSGGVSNLSLSTSNNGLATRPNITGPITYPKNWRDTGGTWFNTAPFAKPANGYFGNAGVGTIRNPGVAVSNMALYKTFPITERMRLQFRAEYFNVFNHTNPNGPATGFGSASFGTITGEKEAREGQGSLKLSF